MHDIQKLFNVAYCIDFIEKYQNYYDMFCFASNTNNPSIVNFYLNNITVLEKFKFYFKDKAKNLIKKSNENKILLPNYMRTDFNRFNNENSYCHDLNKKKLLQSITPKHYFLAGSYEGLALTKREVDVLELLHILAETSHRFWFKSAPHSG